VDSLLDEFQATVSELLAGAAQNAAGSPEPKV